MKIDSLLVLSRSFYPAIGGAEKQALELSRASRAGKTLLTHLSDASAARAARLIKGDPCVELARDLMRRRI